MYKSNAASFISKLKKVPNKWEDRLGKKITNTIKFVHQSLIDKTPVHEGTTVRNYILTMDSPYSGGEIAAIGTGDPGRTSTMSLGSEPRRPANERAALATQANLNLKTNIYRKVYITNNSHAVGGLEMGDFPGGGLRSRSPNGMFGITMQEAIDRLKSGSIK